LRGDLAGGRSNVVVTEKENCRAVPTYGIEHWRGVISGETEGQKIHQQAGENRGLCHRKIGKSIIPTESQKLPGCKKVPGMTVHVVKVKPRLAKATKGDEDKKKRDITFV